MKLLLDINVLLDVVLDRHPWAAAGSALLSAVERGQAEGFVAAHTLTTIFYVVADARDRATAKNAVTDLLRILDVAVTSRTAYQEALAMSIGDFEDAVQATAALTIEADYLVTRDDKDFRSASVSIADPATILALIRAEAS